MTLNPAMFLLQYPRLRRCRVSNDWRINTTEDFFFFFFFFIFSSPFFLFWKPYFCDVEEMFSYAIFLKSSFISSKFVLLLLLLLLLSLLLLLLLLLLVYAKPGSLAARL